MERNIFRAAFLSAALAIILVGTPDTSVNMNNVTQIEKEGDAKVKDILREYVALVNPESVVINSAPVRINRTSNPDVLEKYSLKSSISETEGNKRSFRSTTTYGSDGALLTATLTTNRPMGIEGSDLIIDENFLKQTFTFLRGDSQFCYNPTMGVTSCMAWMTGIDGREMIFEATGSNSGELKVSISDLRTMICGLPPFE